MAVPQPITLLLFRFNGIDRQFCIAPGYDASVDTVIENDLKEILSSGGFRIERDALPSNSWQYETEWHSMAGIICSTSTGKEAISGS